jgi:hypothetical protein
MIENGNRVMGGPIAKDYFPLGEGRGIQLTVWNNNLQLTRTEKNMQTNKWESKQEINLAAVVLKELMWRIPIILEKMSVKEKA